MPHLSPLSWALAPLIFWFVLLSLMTSLWWTQGASFPTYQASSKFSFSSWNWK